MEILENINFSYQNTVILKDFNLDIPSKGITLLSGRNGVGKTTIIEIILGILKPKKGAVNDSIHWGYVPDSSKNIFEGITPTIYFDYVSKLQKLNLRSTEELVSDLEKKFQFDSELNTHNMANLSLGQRKKTLIIGALIQNTDALVLDEPFSGLDKESVVELKEILNDVSKKKPCLIITHDIPDGLQIIEKVVVKRQH